VGQEVTSCEALIEMQIFYRKQRQNQIDLTDVMNGRKIRAIAFFIVMSVLTSSIATPAFSEENVFQFGKDTSLQTSMLQFKGKTIEIQLKSGGQLVGKLSEVGSQSILLKELRGKEYHDALIVIDDIAAVIFRAR
jgi:hypothetical protein